MEYNFKEIEQRWKKHWDENKIYKVTEDKSKPKYYVLDMFPYPSGEGLHVGHPLGYIASDIFSRYKRMKGFNVLHPMGYDAYGLPAEQYAIQTGQHPAVTTEKNIKRYREQLDLIGFSYDWTREVRTCEPIFYKWTQWAFIQMFNSYYDKLEKKAKPISDLISLFEKQGTQNSSSAASNDDLSFTANEWKGYDKNKKQEILLNYRIAYLADTMVNWCPQLGTVLANDEVINGLSERGGYPVEQKIMRQWSLRVSAYAERLLQGLNKIDWSDSLKETQRNWIGKSEGAEMKFRVKDSDMEFEVFTTRPDTIFGVTFMVLAPESNYLNQVTTAGQKKEVEAYIAASKKHSERDRLINKSVSGTFTGAYAVNPFSGKEISIWVSDYVLAGYGTGAIMAVPAHDSRDYAFAKHFDLDIIPLIEGCDISQESFDAKEGVMTNSGFLDGLQVQDAIEKARNYIEKEKLGKVKTNYRLRDAIFSRQRYWGEPFPVYYKDELPYMIPENCLPLELPEVDKFLPTETGEPPLGRATMWAWDTANKKVVDKSEIDNQSIFPIELNTMPGFAGSSAYSLRHMDPKNEETLVDRSKVEYWQNVDLYLGGTEHATGHLIYSRFWNMFLFDIGITVKEEPFQKLVNQGMIQGRSSFVYRINGTNKFVSHGLKEEHDTTSLHVDVNIVENDVLNLDKFKAWRLEFNDAEFILENDKYICGHAVEKMSKSFFNVVNPDTIVNNYGADTLRLYEMFLGPLEQSKPWDASNIGGVSRFLHRAWGLFYENGKNIVVDEEPNKEELKILHTLIKRVSENIEGFSFNTSVSAFMICVNELNALKSNKKAILRDFTITLAPFAPFIAEELWQNGLGNKTSIATETWVEYNNDYLVEDTIRYPVQFNGRVRYTIDMPADASKEEVEKAALADTHTQKWLEGKDPKKVIVILGRIVNIVI